MQVLKNAAETTPSKIVLKHPSRTVNHNDSCHKENKKLFQKIRYLLKANLLPYFVVRFQCLDDWRWLLCTFRNEKYISFEPTLKMHDKKHINTTFSLTFSITYSRRHWKLYQKDKSLLIRINEEFSYLPGHFENLGLIQ